MVKGDNGKLVEENSTLVANGRSKQRNSDEGFSKYLFNRQNGTFLGRTAKSWCKLLVFYVIFYICLAAFWVACLAIFLKTIDPNIPRFYGKGTIIGTNPGVGYQPHLREDPESTLLKFNSSDPNSYAKYVKVMDNYYSKYNNVNGTRKCSGTQSNQDVVKDGKVINSDAEACRFELKEFADNQCSSSTAYGFRSGTPCIILSLNRLIGWTPESYDDGEVPKEIKDRYQKGSIAFHCTGIGDDDKEHVHSIDYIPKAGIHGRYYPFAVMSNYHQPFTIARFKNLPRNRAVMVACWAYAKNIEHDFLSRLGIATFEFFISN